MQPACHGADSWRAGICLAGQSWHAGRFKPFQVAIHFYTGTSLLLWRCGWRGTGRRHLQGLYGRIGWSVFGLLYGAGIWGYDDRYDRQLCRYRRCAYKGYDDRAGAYRQCIWWFPGGKGRASGGWYHRICGRTQGTIRRPGSIRALCAWRRRHQDHGAIWAWRQDRCRGSNACTGGGTECQIQDAGWRCRLCLFVRVFR